MPPRIIQQPVRYICHQCLCLSISRSPPSTNEDEGSLRCRRCGSEFIELLGSSRHRSRQANVDHQGDALGAPMPSSEEDSGGEEAMNPHLVVANPLGQPHPIQLLDLIGFLTGQRSDSPFGRAFGLYSDIRDYAVTEEAFQGVLHTLFDQMGVKVQGLNGEQLATLERIVIDKDDGLGECAVCQEAYKKGDTLINLVCQHKFHESCIEPWLAQVASCPVCRIDPMTGNLLSDKGPSTSL